MHVKQVVSVEIPESLSYRLDVILQATGQTPDQLLLQLLSDYTDSFMDKVRKAFSSTVETDAKDSDDWRRNMVKGERIDITMHMIETAYKNAVKVYNHEVSRTDGKILTHKESGMSLGSAQDYITDFLAMMNGKEYHRTMANDATRYFLKRIHADFGRECFTKAVSATRQHIKYYNGLGRGQLNKKEEMVNELEKELGT